MAELRLPRCRRPRELGHLARADPATEEAVDRRHARGRRNAARGGGAEVEVSAGMRGGTELLEDDGLGCGHDIHGEIGVAADGGVVAGEKVLDLQEAWGRNGGGKKRGAGQGEGMRKGASLVRAGGLGWVAGSARSGVGPTELHLRGGANRVQPPRERKGVAWQHVASAVWSVRR